MRSWLLCFCGWRCGLLEQLVLLLRASMTADAGGFLWWAGKFCSLFICWYWDENCDEVPLEYVSANVFCNNIAHLYRFFRWACSGQVQSYVILYMLSCLGWCSLFLSMVAEKRHLYHRIRWSNPYGMLWQLLLAASATDHSSLLLLGHYGGR